MFYVTQIEQLKLENQLLLLKNKFEDSNRGNENALRLLHEQNDRVEKNIKEKVERLQDKIEKKFDDLKAVLQNTTDSCKHCAFDEGNTETSSANSTIDMPSHNHEGKSSHINDVIKCCVDDVEESKIKDTTKTENVEKKDFDEEEKREIFDAQMRRRRFGKLHRTLSSSSIPSENDDDNNDYTPFVNNTKTKTSKDTKIKNNEDDQVQKYIDSLPMKPFKTCAEGTSQTNNGQLDNQKMPNCVNDRTKELSDLKSRNKNEMKIGENTKSQSPTIDNDLLSSNATPIETTTQQLLSPSSLGNRNDGPSCTRFQIPEITITDTMAAFYHFENATEQQCSVYMNEE